MKQFSICALLGVLALPVAAQDAVTYPFEGSFDDATFSVESAIIGRGLVIDYVSHTGDMLNRTAADVGSDKILCLTYISLLRQTALPDYEAVIYYQHRRSTSV